MADITAEHQLKLKPLYGSDIGHWDVTDMSEIVEAAYELDEHKLISERDLQSSLFENAVAFWTGNNCDFFRGTIIEKEAGRRRAENIRNKEAYRVTSN